jgi:hypothetical protein
MLAIEKGVTEVGTLADLISGIFQTNLSPQSPGKNRSED